MNTALNACSERNNALKDSSLRMGWGGRILALLVAALSLKAGTSEGMTLPTLPHVLCTTCSL